MEWNAVGSYIYGVSELKPLMLCLFKSMARTPYQPLCPMTSVRRDTAEATLSGHFPQEKSDFWRRIHTAFCLRFRVSWTVSPYLVVPPAWSKWEKTSGCSPGRPSLLSPDQSWSDCVFAKVSLWNWWTVTTGFCSTWKLSAPLTRRPLNWSPAKFPLLLHQTNSHFFECLLDLICW